MTSGFKFSPVPACDCRPHGCFTPVVGFLKPGQCHAMGRLLPSLLRVPLSWGIHNSSFDPSVDLTPADLQVDSSTNPQSFRVFIKCAKTDPFRCGCFIFFGHGSAPLCPVLTLTNYLYLYLRGPGIGPLFIFQDGRPLPRALLSSFLQATLQEAGIPLKFSGHGFRIGAATTATQRGVPDHLIKTTGCLWSEAYLFYVRTPVDTILSVAGRIS